MISLDFKKRRICPETCWGIAINSTTIEVTLATAADARDLPDSVTAKDADGAAIVVNSVEFAPWSTDSKDVLVTLAADTVIGKYYTITSGEKSVNFGGKTIDTTAPTVSSVNKSDYNEFTVDFSEPILLGGTVSAALKYTPYTDLQTSTITYVDCDTIKVANTVDQTTALYSTTIKGFKDLAGNTMADDASKTFVGVAKDTSVFGTPTVSAIDSTTVKVDFGKKYDSDTCLDASKYTVKLKYSPYTEIAVLSVAADADTSTAVDLTLADDTTVSLYEVTVAAGVKTAYGVITTSSISNTFVGAAKDTDAIGSFTAEAKSNTKVVITMGNDAVKDAIDATTAMDVFSIKMKYSPYTALSISAISISKNVVTLTTSAQTGDLYEITMKAGVKDKKGNATTAEIKNTFVGKTVAAKPGSVTVTRVKPAGYTGSFDADTQIFAKFDVNVGSNATDVALYTIDNGVGYPSRVQLVDGTNNGDKVLLTIGKTVDNKVYTLTVKGLKNADEVAMDSSASITNTFPGRGSSATLASIDAIMPLDKNAFEVFFDREVTDSTVSGLIWGASDLGVAGKTTVDIKKGSGNYVSLDTANCAAFKDPLNTKGIVVRYTAASQIASATSEVIYIKFTSKYILDASGGKEFVFASSNADPVGPKVDGVLAENKNTILVYFDQAMDAVTIVTGNIDIVDAKGSSTAQVADNSVVKVDDKTFRIYTAALDAPATATADDDGQYYLKLSNAVHNFNGVSIAAESSSDTSHYALFGISTAAISEVSDVQVVSLDKRTLKVFYPVSMEVGTVGGIAAGDANYTLSYSFVDGNNAVISGVPIVKWIKYSDSDHSATLYLNGDMPSAANGNYLVIKNEISTAANSSVKVKNEGTYNAVTGIRRQFAVTGTDAPRPKIASASVSTDNKKLTIVFDQPIGFALDFDGTSASADTIVNNVALAAVPAEDAIVLNGTSAGTITDTKFFTAIKITASLTVAGNDIALDNTYTDDVDLSSDGKTVVVTLTNDTFKADSTGVVSTDVAASATAYNRVVSACLVEQGTGDNKSEATFVVPPSNVYDITAPVIAGIETMDTNANGKVDTLKVIFNEAVSDSTYTNTSATLSAAGDNVDQLGTLVTTAIASSSLAGKGITDVSNDNIIYLDVTENTGATNYNTGITGTFDTVAANMIKDIAGNGLEDNAGATALTDKAAPVLLATSNGDDDGDGKIDIIKLLFSEKMSLQAAIAANADAQKLITALTVNNGASDVNIVTKPTSVAVNGGNGTSNEVDIMLAGNDIVGTGIIKVTLDGDNDGFDLYGSLATDVALDKAAFALTDDVAPVLTYTANFTAAATPTVTLTASEALAAHTAIVNAVAGAANAFSVLPTINWTANGGTDATQFGIGIIAANATTVTITTGDGTAVATNTITGGTFGTAVTADTTGIADLAGNEISVGPIGTSTAQ